MTVHNYTKANSYTHEQRAHGLYALCIEWTLSTGVADKKPLFVTLTDLIP